MQEHYACLTASAIHQVDAVGDQRRCQRSEEGTYLGPALNAEAKAEGREVVTVDDLMGDEEEGEAKDK